MQHPPRLTAQTLRRLPSESVDDTLRAALRNIARYFPYGVVLLFLFLLLLSIAAPFFAHFGHSGLSEPSYGLLSWTCHQLPERCFRILGHPVGICQRCASLDFGLLVGSLALLATGKLAFLFAGRTGLVMTGGICLLPLAIDGTASFVGLWDSPPAVRMLTGLVAGLWLGGLIIARMRPFCRDAARLLD